MGPDPPYGKEDMTNLSDAPTRPEPFEPAWAMGIQTAPREVAITVQSGSYGSYRRNSGESPLGRETAKAQPRSTTTRHLEECKASAAGACPLVELKTLSQPDHELIARIMGGMGGAHDDEENGTGLPGDFSVGSAQTACSDNLNLWWNDGGGLSTRTAPMEDKK